MLVHVRLLGSCWVHVGAMLGPCWGHVEPTFGQELRVPFGAWRAAKGTRRFLVMLGPCWAYVGLLSGLCWPMLGPWGDVRLRTFVYLVYLSVYSPSIYEPIDVSITPAIHQSLSLSIHTLFLYPLNPNNHGPGGLSSKLSIYLSIDLSTHLSVCLSV